MCVLQGTGEFTLLSAHSPMLLTFVWFLGSISSGAASLYLHKYLLSVFEIYNTCLYVCVLRGSGEFRSVATFSTELLMFA
jgi:hypothetical protein